MSIIFSDDFDAGQTQFDMDWVNGGVALQAGGCTDNGYILAFGNSSASRTFTPTPTVSFRAQIAALLGASASAEPIWAGFPTVSLSGAIFAFGIRGDGAVYVRMNNAASKSFSSAGVAPVDGTLFALQWRAEIISAFVLQLSIDINNVTVFTTTYNWTAFDVGFGGATGNIDKIYVLPHNFSSGVNLIETGIDNLEVDNSTAAVTWNPCTSLQFGTPAPVAIVTDLAIDCGTGYFTITGTDFRPDPLPTVSLEGPEGQSIVFNYISRTSTDLVLNPMSSFVEGQYCVTVDNFVFIWET